MAIHTQVQKKEAQFSTLSYTLPPVSLPEDLVHAGPRKPKRAMSKKTQVVIGIVAGAVLGIGVALYMGVLPMPGLPF